MAATHIQTHKACSKIDNTQRLNFYQYRRINRFSNYLPGKIYHFRKIGLAYPAVRVKDCSEKPTARAGRGGKGKARTCNGKPDRRCYGLLLMV